MPGLLPHVDPDGLLEYSVVYTDRAVNHMSQSFQGAMRDISKTLKVVYGAAGVAVVPGSGTHGMEAVARQLATQAGRTGPHATVCAPPSPKWSPRSGPSDPPSFLRPTSKRLPA